MSTAHASRPTRSLAAVETGERIEIRRILFGALRTLCDDLGLHEGEVVRCRACTPSHVLMETTEGRTISLERDWARFIQVAPPHESRPARLRNRPAPLPG